MKILLTGGNGMVGRNLLEYSESKNYTFLAPSQTELNLLKYTQVYEYIFDNKPDLIIHAAGVVGGIQANISNPVKFLIDNVDIGKNVIQAAKNNKIKRLINLGSSCMYPRNAENPLKENFILNGELEPTNEGYAIAKIVAARLCEYINREDDFFEYKTIIPCNLYGRFDKFDPKHSHMIPAVIKKIHDACINNEESVEIWGDGEARREFMYTEDLADFIFYSIRNFDKLPQNINVGLGYDYSIKEYYKIISECVGFKGGFEYDLSKPSGMRQKLVDVSKVSELGWKPKTSLKKGIQKTFEYYIKTI